MSVTLERILSLLPQGKNGKPVHGAKTALARDLGLPSNIFAEWVGGRNKSYNNYLYQIAAKYNVSVEWLKGETDEKKPALKEDEQRIADILDNMDRAQLLDIIARATEILKDK